jgi:hypothetical protein
VGDFVSRSVEADPKCRFVSLARPRSRCSSTSIEGGKMKIATASAPPL